MLTQINEGVPQTTAARTAELMATSRTALASSLRLKSDLEELCQQVQSEVARLQQFVVAVRQNAQSLAEARRRGVPKQAAVAQADAELVASLTPREREVLKLVGEGKRNKEIAHLLGITVKTAVTHRAHIMDKLSIHEGPVLVRFAIRNGLCSA